MCQLPRQPIIVIDDDRFDSHQLDASGIAQHSGLGPGQCDAAKVWGHLAARVLRGGIARFLEHAPVTETGHRMREGQRILVAGPVRRQADQTALASDFRLAIRQQLDIAFASIPLARGCCWGV